MQTSGISILGCGFLGFSMANFLVKKGFQVAGSTTTHSKIAELQKNHIQAFELSLNPYPIGDDWDSFLQKPTLIINIPPKSQQNGQDFHVEQITHLIKLLEQSEAQRIFYVSSTSVYPEKNQIADEQSEIIDNHFLIKAENLLLNLPHKEVIALRCGGLFGAERIAGKSLAGKPTNTGNLPVNFVHRDDVVHIIFELLAHKFQKEVFNVVSPLHPTRQEVYLAQAQKYGFASPLFDADLLPYKIVDSTKIQQYLNYQFLYPNPIDF